MKAKYLQRNIQNKKYKQNTLNTTRTIRFIYKNKYKILPK